MFYIQDSQALSEIFGGWPSFHDAEVVSVLLDRQGGGESAGPTLDAKIHVFEMTTEVDAHGHYVLRNHTLATLRFMDVDGLRLEDFNHQNVLWDLEIRDISGPGREVPTFEVCFNSSFGLSAVFRCRSIAVVAAEPFAPEG